MNSNSAAGTSNKPTERVTRKVTKKDSSKQNVKSPRTSKEPSSFGQVRKATALQRGKVSEVSKSKD